MFVLYTFFCMEDWQVDHIAMFTRYSGNNGHRTPGPGRQRSHRLEPVMIQYRHNKPTYQQVSNMLGPCARKLLEVF